MQACKSRRMPPKTFCNWDVKRSTASESCRTIQCCCNMKTNSSTYPDAKPVKSFKVYDFSEGYWKTFDSVGHCIITIWLLYLANIVSVETALLIQRGKESHNWSKTHDCQFCGYKTNAIFQFSNQISNQRSIEHFPQDEGTISTRNVCCLGLLYR